MITADQLSLPESAQQAKAQVAEITVQSMRDLVSQRGVGATHLTLDIVDCACLLELIDMLKRRAGN